LAANRRRSGPFAGKPTPTGAGPHEGFAFRVFPCVSVAKKSLPAPYTNPRTATVATDTSMAPVKKFQRDCIWRMASSAP